MTFKELKILLVDTNIASLPIFKAAKELGAEVHVIGNNPSDFLCSVADKYWDLDYSEMGSLSNLINTEGFDYIVPGSNDQSYLACMSLKDAQMRPGYETLSNTITLNKKSEFRKLCGSIGLTSPRSYSSFNDADLAVPLIVKPVDSYSGKGVTILHSLDDLQVFSAIELAEKHSPSGEYILEEYIDGQMYSHSAFIENGRIQKDFFVVEDSLSYAFAVDTSACVDKLDVAAFQSLVLDIKRLIKELDIRSGLLHTQFIVSNGKAYVIEVTKRCPGDLYSQLIEKSTGYPYAKKYLYGFLGRELIAEEIEHAYIIRHTLTTKHKGTFTAVNLQVTNNDIELYHLVKAGDLCTGVDYTRIGLMFIKLNSKAEMQATYLSILSGDAYKVSLN